MVACTFRAIKQLFIVLYLHTSFIMLHFFIHYALYTIIVDSTLVRGLLRHGTPNLEPHPQRGLMVWSLSVYENSTYGTCLLTNANRQPLAIIFQSIPFSNTIAINRMRAMSRLSRILNMFAGGIPASRVSTRM